MSDIPPRILDYSDPHHPIRSVREPIPVETNTNASIPLAVGTFYLLICAPLGLVAFLLAGGADALAKHWLPASWGDAIGCIVAAACLSWPLIYGLAKGMQALSEIKRSPARGYQQAIVGMFLCSIWLIALLLISGGRVVDILRN